MKWTNTCVADSCLSDEITAPLQLPDCATVPAFAPTQSTPQPFGFYAVTRINPLFVEDKSISNVDSNNGSGSNDSNHFKTKNNDNSIHKAEIICNGSGGNYTYGPIAIGIDSNNHHIDIDIDDTDDPDTDAIDYSPEYSLRDDAFAVLKQNYDFIRSVLVSVRVNGRRCLNRPSHHQLHRLASRSSRSKIAYSSRFATSISDRDENSKKCVSRTNPHPLQENESWFAASSPRRLNDVSEVTLNRSRNSYHGHNHGNKHGHSQHSRRYPLSNEPLDEGHQNGRVAMAFENKKHPQHDLSPRQLSRNVGIGDANKDDDRNAPVVAETRISPLANSPLEIVLRCLRDKIDECLRNTDSPTRWPSSSNDPAITTLYRAYRLINAYHRKCSLNLQDNRNETTLDEDLVEKCQVDLLQCLGRIAYYADECCECSSSFSSSSAASTSGFSDLTPTPPFSDTSTSASDSPTPVPVSALMSINQAATTPNNKFNCARIVGFAKRTNNRFKIKNAICSRTPQRRHVSFEPFRGAPSLHSFTTRKNGIDGVHHHFEQCRRIDIVQTDDKPSQKPTSQLRPSSYPGHRCPDFTLDVHQAEKVVEKIKNRKKERCWCQIITCCVGFVFLLLSVMSFSMVLSRGEKLFGPL